MKKPARFLLIAMLLFPVDRLRAADTYEIDAVHSSVLFKIRHLNVADFYGRFNDVTGTVSFDKENPAKSSVTLEVKIDSVDTHNAKRDQHLKSPDFFNARQFPVMTFKSTKVEKAGEAAYKVTGDFTLHGVTKPITVDFKRGGEGKGMQGETRSGGATDFTIKRSEYGMSFMLGGLGDEVEITLSLEGVKK